jgi:hypothetical protein
MAAPTSPLHTPRKKFVIESVAKDFAGIGIAVVAAVAAAAPVLSIHIH